MTQKLEPGEYINGYTLEEEIGKGGFGVVWKVKSNEDDIKAMKFIKPEFTEYLFKEAQALKKLKHPNIISIEEVNTTHSFPYLLMECCESNLRKLGKLALTETIEFIGKIASAISYAHSQGVIHGDIKPENILVNEDLEIKICDFGLAKIISDSGSSHLKLSDKSTINKYFTGTQKYASPEQLEGFEPTVLTDVYSLNLVLFELVTGRHLGLRENVYEALKNEIPKIKKTKRASWLYDEGIDKIIIKGLEYEPEKRYQSMEDFILSFLPEYEKIIKPNKRIKAVHKSLNILNNFNVMRDTFLDIETDIQKKLEQLNTVKSSLPKKTIAFIENITELFKVYEFAINPIDKLIVRFENNLKQFRANEIKYPIFYAIFPEVNKMLETIDFFYKNFEPKHNQLDLLYKKIV